MEEMVTITHVIYPLTEKVLGQLFDVYGVNDVCLLQQSTHIEAFVEFQSWHEASEARGALHGRCIYDGCCLLDIQHAPLSISVIRLPNSKAVVVDWDQVEVAPLASSSNPSASTQAMPLIVITSATISEVSPGVHPAKIGNIIDKALDCKVLVSLAASHNSSAPATTKVGEALEDAFPVSAGHVTMAPTTAGQVICKSQGGVYVPSQPRNPPDPTQGFLVCDPIREFTHENLRLVLLQIVEWDPGIIHCTSLDNRNLDETYEVKSIGWYVSHSTDFPSTDSTFDSNYASYENGMSIGIEQEAEYETRLQFLSDSAQCQHIARVVRSLIGRFKQLETLQRACSRYSIPFSCSVLIGNFPACAFLSAASFNAGCFRRHVMNSVSLPLPWDPGILLGIFYGHLFGTRNSGTVLQYCNKFKFNDYHLAWCSGSSTTMFCLYFQWMLSSGFSVEKLCVPRVICRVQFLSTLESSHFMTLEHHLTYCLRHDQTNELHKYYIDAHRDKMSFVTFPTASMKCHDPISATWCFSACVVFSMINQLWHWHSACWRYPCLIELKQQLHHGVIYTTHGYGGPNFSCNVGEGHMETSYPFAANYRICFRYRTGGRLNQPSAENVGAQYNKHTGEDIVRALGHEQKTTELLVIRDLVLSVQGLQGFDLLIVREPQAMYMIAPMPLVTYVEVLDAHVQWDPGGFLSTMSGEHELNHTERSRRLHEIGARGYKMIIGMNNLSTPWDLGIVKIYEPAVRVHVKARRLYCESESYKLLLPAHAIAWGQAMFCRGGSVTPVVLPGLHLSDRLLMWARPNRSSLGEKDKETGGQHDSAWKKWFVSKLLSLAPVPPLLLMYSPPLLC